MQKPYAVAVYLNISLSVLFIVSVVFGLSASRERNAEDWAFFTYFMLAFGNFLWLGFRSLKLHKYNTGLISLKKWQRKLGKTVAVTAIVLAASLLLAAVAGFSIFTNEATKNQLRLGWLYMLLLSLLLAAAAAAIVNAAYYFKALKHHQQAVNNVINTIGETN
jgi:hypothetical protein